MGAVMLSDPPEPPSLVNKLSRDSSGNHTGPGGIIPGAMYGTSWKGTHATPISSSKSKSSWSTTVSVILFPERRIPGGAVNENACPHTGSSVLRWVFVRRRAPGAAVTTQYGSARPSVSAAASPRASKTFT